MRGSAAVIGLQQRDLHLLRWEEVSSQCVKEGRRAKLGGGTGGQRYLRRLNMFSLCRVFLERARVRVLLD